MIRADGKQIARRLLRGDLLISVTAQRVLMRAKICAKKRIYCLNKRPSSLECVFMGTVNLSWTRHGDYDLLEMGNVGKMAP